MGKNDPPDFSSKDYWQTRFGHETSFEWLARAELIVPVVVALADQVLRSKRQRRSSGTRHDAQEGEGGEGGGDGEKLRILHFGCGSSNLGSDVQVGLNQHFSPPSPLPAGPASGSPPVYPVDIQVIDADYVPPELLSPRPIPVIQLDVLAPQSLREAAAHHGQWDLIIDKSTADAISCGPNLPRALLHDDLVASSPDSWDRRHAVEGPDDADRVEPIEVLCANLARVTSKGGKWVSISYSASRFSHLSSPGAPASTRQTSDATDGAAQTRRAGWKVVEKRPVASTSMPEGRVIKDGKGFRTVYEPETPVWIYTLERT